jgi:hypothetical protein
MAEYNFTTNPGETVARELLVAYLNTGSKESPVWSPLGKRVEDSSAEYDWGESTSQDIIGNTWAKMKKPIITQTFEPCDLDAGDAAQQKIWQLAVVEQNAPALANMDVLIAHLYAGFGERYESCMVKPSSLGGEGGGSIGMPIDITYGGNRTIGSVSNTGGTVKFTAEVGV